MSTPHIGAAAGAFAPTVLMPGDPLRARWIAEHFLEGAEEITSIRGMLGFTGRWRGQRVSVMAHGMGVPSACIYATELIRFFGARSLVRVGSCGALHPDLELGEVVVATAASTDSAVNRARAGGADLAAVADFGLVRSVVAAAERLGRGVRVGPVFTSDLFYPSEGDLGPLMARLGHLAVEMETAGLYGVALEEGASAVALLTVSDRPATGERLTAAQREVGVGEMVELALEGVLGQR